MTVRKGKGVYGGVAIGHISFLRHKPVEIRRNTVVNGEAEISRYRDAKAKTLEELQALYQKAANEIGSDEAQIFDIHMMMVEDEDYNDAITAAIIDDKVNAECAVADVRDNFANMFSAMEDPYLNARAADVRDISNRILQNLSGHNEAKTETETGSDRIVCADDLAPSETMTLDKSTVMAFVTFGGSVSSHTAILARTMEIPAVVGLGEPFSSDMEGALAVVDGFTGTVYLNPDDETLEKARKEQAEALRDKALLENYKGRDNVTLDGQRIDVFANIQRPHEVSAALMNDAGGIGLMRSEFLFLEHSTFPTEDEQFESYKSVLQSMCGKKVVIRTLDVGADKQINYFGLAKESNPAMGMRAIRICLTRPEIFKTQLRALYRASVFGKLAIMFPMIISTEEVKRILAITEEVKEELHKDGVPFSETVELGVMIETPAAALISDELAQLVDFFSIGTNDLSQYTLAIDRQNQSLSEFFNPHHPAVLKLIEMAAESAHKYGKWIGICGELGADISLTETFMRMHIDELSVSPPYVLKVRETVCGLKLEKKS